MRAKHSPAKSAKPTRHAVAPASAAPASAEDTAAAVTQRNRIARLYGHGGAKQNAAVVKKDLDIAVAPPVESPASALTPSTERPPTPERSPEPIRSSTMTLTLKGLTHSKYNKDAIYVGARKTIHIPLANFSGEPPATLVDFSNFVGPKPVMTAEERKAARKAAPKPTLAEKAAKLREKLAKLEAKAATEAQTVSA